VGAPTGELARGLTFYNARYYDPGLGRFTQPDTLVPNPGDPQSLNRYSYAGNNPLRYVDPSGHFSEDEIMKYLHVDNWDAVLAMFGDGGKFAGAWGWLEVLREAESGDQIEVWVDHQPHLTGYFSEKDGELMFADAIDGADAKWSIKSEALGLMASGGNSHVSYWVRNETENVFVGNYMHTHVIDRGVDWAGVAVAGTSLTLDVVSGGTVGVAKDIAKTSALVVDLTFITIDFLRVSETGEDVWETTFWDAASFVPIAGDAAYIGYQLYENVYIGP